MKSRIDRTGMILGTLCFLVSVGCPAFADVSPGDVIDKTNWEKAEGLLPTPVLEWVKKGEFVLNVGELDHNLVDFLPYWKESLEKNVGKYAIDDRNDQIVEAATGKEPEFIEGYPFPGVKPEDRRGILKMVYNHQYWLAVCGSFTPNIFIQWIGEKKGLEREIFMDVKLLMADGYPPAREMSNPNNILLYELLVARSPYDVAGVAMMTWRFRNQKLDTNFAYLPAIRRVRQTSPASRSDSIIGSDFCLDDGFGFHAKPCTFEWKFVREQEALVPVTSVHPKTLVRDDEGQLLTTENIPTNVYGWQTEGWQGATWAPTSFVWVKRPIWVIHGMPKDPYYNYGLREVWMDPEVLLGRYAVIHDRAGQYLKTFLTGCAAYQTQDGKERLLGIDIQHMIDDRTRHCSIVEHASKRNPWVFHANLEMDDFSLGGFQKFCK